MERLEDYDYELPTELIAQSPLPERSDSRLLHLDRRTGQTHHRRFRDVPELLRPGDLLVMNETRVSAIRLFGHKPTGGAVEALLIRERAPGVFDAMLAASRRLALGAVIEFEGGLRATVVMPPLHSPPNNTPKLARICFDETPDLAERLDAIGHAPLPPYIHAPLAERERYQTVYGRAPGSTAAPTAGLHFTETMIAELESLGIRIAKITLHVGTDTFLPIRTDPLENHPMSGEHCTVPPETAAIVKEAEGRIIAVGTTTVRTLESFAVGRRRITPGEMSSRLFIRPGHDYRVVDGMFTNFHMPRTTMMLMISALAGREAVMRAYAEAVQKRYRFLSFGDSMLIL